MSRSVVSAWLLAAVAVVLTAFGVVLSILAGPHADRWWENALGFAAVAASLAIGLLIVTRLTGHPIGWLLLANAVLLASFGAAAPYAQYAVQERPGALPGPEWAVLWDQSAWPLLFLLLTAIVLVFPDGRLPSARWRRIAVVAATGCASFVVLGFFGAEPFEAPYERVDRPLPELPEASGVLWPVAMLGVLTGLVAAVVAARMRFRDARGTERLQMRWLAYTALLVPLTLVICVAGALASGGAEDGGLFNALFLFVLGAIPASISVAVLRYRLYDVDRIIIGSLVYGTLTLLLAGAYGAATLVLGTALGSGSAWATAGATLAVAVAFRPLRRLVQDAVDRRFSRARYEGRRRIAEFLEDLRAGRIAPEAVEGMLSDVLGDPGLEVRFWLAESGLYVDSRGHRVEDVAGDRRERTPVQRAGAPLAVVLHNPPPDEPAGLLEEMVEEAGLAIEIARLRAELRRQLQEVEASRARIVAAGYEERRRIERDLHDGAQQRLVSIGLALRHAQHELAPPAGVTSAALDAAVRELALAIEELRELAQGVRPARLDDGLASALGELAARSPLPVDVNASAERFPADIEAAAYFIACEGLTNAVKHAHATRVTVTAERMNGKLVISISDDGIGGASASRGSGLSGLSDRVQAHRGALRLERGNGTGTTLVAELPCGS
ncbi:MAG TPA: histidine kinase [Solirubrobacteraceae bacterium]|nr:histidine kinase [Solirubrobacteraceae bacterium]